MTDESVFEWARSLSPEHVCVWDEVILEPNGLYDAVNEQCRICDTIRQTGMVLISR